MAAATTAQIEHERSISEAVGVDDGVSDTTCTPTRGGASHTGWGRSDTAEHQEHARLGCSWRPEWWRDSLRAHCCQFVYRNDVM